MKYFLTSLLFITVLANYSAPGLLAQGNSSGVGFSVFPAVQEFVVDPGDSIDGGLLLETTSISPYPVQIFVVPLATSDEIIDPSADNIFQANDWIVLDTAQTQLLPGEITEVNFTINVPEDATPGGYYAFITTRNLQLERTLSETDTTILPEVNASVLINVTGEINEDVEIDDSSLIAETITKGSAQLLSFNVNNIGNIHSFVEPILTIYSDDEEIARFPIQSQLILPNTSRTFEVEWIADVDYGKYKAQVSLEFGSDDQTRVGFEKTFRVSPPTWQLVALGSIGALTLLIALRWRSVPRLIDALKGKSVSMKRSYKVSENDDNILNSDDMGTDYQDIINELENQASILGLPKNPYQRPVGTTKTKAQIAKKESSTRKKAKTAQLKSMAKSKKAIVSEEIHTATDSKTVVIQTSNSTIVREENLDKPVKTPTKIAVKTSSVPVAKKRSSTKKVKVATKATPKKSTRKKPSPTSKKTIKKKPKKKSNK